MLKSFCNRLSSKLTTIFVFSKTSKYPAKQKHHHADRKSLGRLVQILFAFLDKSEKSQADDSTITFAPFIFESGTHKKCRAMPGKPDIQKKHHHGKPFSIVLVVAGNGGG
jgi:hypothetical protein